MPRRRISTRETKQLSLLGGSKRRFNEADTNWNFSNLITPSTNEHRITEALDDSSATSSSSADSQSTYSNDDYAEEDFTNDVVSTHRELKGGNRLINLQDLNKALTSTTCCNSCARNENKTLMDSFIDFCEEEIGNIFQSCQPMTSYNQKLLRKMSVRKFYEKWKETPISNFNTVPLTMTEMSHGLASVISLECPHCKEEDAYQKKKEVIVEPWKRKTEREKTRIVLCQYDINIRFCLALQLMGVGGQHASILTAFLDLPEPHKWPRQFSTVEKFLHKSTEKVKCESQEKATEEEIIMTNVPDSCIEQTLLEDMQPRYRIEASFDMGWQVRSSGGKYGSSTGHGLMIGALSKKVMDSVVYNKKCAICTKNKSGTKKHDCVKNYEGSSKSMEASALTKMLIRIPEEKGASICTIITDDDSNGRSKARHIHNGGILPLHVEEPAFRADPSHRKRVVARAIYNLSSLPMKKSAVTKGLASHLKYCYGACIKRNRHRTAEELSERIHNILHHICGVHDRCDASWCYDKKAIENNVPYHPPSDHRLDKVKYPDTYNQLQSIFSQYASVEMMQYCNHPHDTQTNEALNQAIAVVAPKSVCYSGTISLFSRIALVIGIHNMGYYNFFHTLFTKTGVFMTVGLEHFLKTKQEKKITKGNYVKRFEVKVARSKRQKKQLHDIYKERTDTSYGHAVALCNMSTKKRQQNSDKSLTNKKCKCGSDSHQRVTHKDCPENPKRMKTSGETSKTNMFDNLTMDNLEER
jgi:hypothetical protein